MVSWKSIYHINAHFILKPFLPCRWLVTDYDDSLLCEEPTHIATSVIECFQPLIKLAPSP